MRFWKFLSRIGCHLSMAPVSLPFEARSGDLYRSAVLQAAHHHGEHGDRPTLAFPYFRAIDLHTDQRLKPLDDFVTDDGFFTNIDLDTNELPSTMVTLRPTYTILDGAAVNKISQAIIEETKAEKGCLFYGWHRDNDTILSQGAFLDGDAVRAHYENVGPLLNSIISEGAGKLECIEIHGPHSEILKTRDVTKKMGRGLFKGAIVKEHSSDSPEDDEDEIYIRE
mmetsp:Transcript_62876/g.141950  ORF Transcript_62876/g.141950 Transcript_62876/m.141950 type:complete len:224 (-) Transcript_62876:153-824(-)